MYAKPAIGTIHCIRQNLDSLKDTLTNTQIWIIIVIFSWGASWRDSCLTAAAAINNLHIVYI